MKTTFEKKSNCLSHLFVIFVCFSLLVGCAGLQAAQETKAENLGSCPNCGMMLKKWAHTNHEFTNSEGHFRTCSLHCVADMSEKSGEAPKNVRAALQLQPETMIPVENAVYVIGSKAPGTMTMVSKRAFASQAEAKNFQAEKGGKLGTFDDAFKVATAELPNIKPKLEKKRQKKGKFVVPSEEDRCVVCNMFPAKYPKNNAQLLTPDKKRFHFCSARCMFEFVNDPEKYGATGTGVGAVWVHDNTSGRFIFGRNAYYVVGSKVLGPMGNEAIPFDLKSDAMAFAKSNGGVVLKFPQVTPAKIRTP
ncbi:MAG: nitrous oxide reductase accessory protein NosL [Pseudomonadota bacterium]